MLHIDELGNVVLREYADFSDVAEHYRRVVQVDLAEYFNHYKYATWGVTRHFDGLDVGYWYLDASGTRIYEPPDQSFREHGWREKAIVKPWRVDGRAISRWRNKLRRLMDRND